ncbi:TonB-dependent receptor [Glaciecola petra]|uniref:TonB-dependent receptor n=1 Tax=Glaciecola petra TaxID=3075602 RepID=A0ABU2ZUA7_9ALTE|nr:TonB-dependent receptor [Aestuariibacter sp. P117]MDT0596220.1 TonB-dependent receptor [Aestuariibacter sp. P117]
MQSKSKVGKYVVATLTFYLAIVSSPAFSVQNEETDKQPTANMEVIAITASKRAEPVTQTPDSLSIQLQSDIQDLSAQHINQVLANVPGTWISRGNGQEHLSAIRSPVLTGAGSCGAFFMGLDGISLRASGFCNANQLFDANYEQAGRIEVLRSPSSTLYGGNALHGVINIMSQDAFAHTENTLSLDAGANDFTRLSHAVGTQGDDSAWLNLINITQENGYQSESGYDQQKMTSIYQSKGKIWSNKSLIDVNNLNQETAGFIRGFESFKDDDIRKSNPNPEAYRDVKSLRAYSAFSRNVKAGELTLTPYIRWNQMAFLQHFLPWQALEENAHTSIGLQSQYTFSANNIDWIAGVDFDHTSGKLKETQEDDFSPNIPAGLHYDYRVKAQLSAGYLQGFWRYEKWRLRVGARFENTKYDYNNLTDSVSACAITVEVCRFTRPEDQKRSFSAMSPSINVQYIASEDWSIYAKFAQGYRAPQATELFRLQNNQLVSDIDTENMEAFELGTRFKSRTTLVHFAAYTMAKQDVIFQDSNRQNVTGAKTAHRGAELELQQTLNKNLWFSGHISYAEHTYKQSDINLSDDIAGNYIDTAPKWMAKANLNYLVNDKIDMHLSWQWLDEYYLNPQNTAEYAGHKLIDIDLNYQYSENLRASLSIFNVGNQAYAERADFAFGAYRYFVGQGRRAFVNLTWVY